jgi:hypothetical protein
MEEAFGTLVWIVAGVAAVIAIFTLAGTGRSYREIGGGGMADDGKPSARSAAAERDEEIRQLLEARNARRERRGEAPLDVDEQFAELTGTKPDVVVDEQLREEMRDHVLARNARRMRAGAEPLDVEAEIARQLGDLT